MTNPLRFYFCQCAIGFAVSAVFVALLLVTDTGDLRHLAVIDRTGLLAIALLWILNGVVFAQLQFAIAVCRVRKNDADDSRRPFR